MDAIYKKLNEVFRQVFDDPSLSVRPETTANDIEEWDSMTHINLIMAVELAFDIEFENAEIRKFRNVGDLAEAVRRRTSKEGSGK